MEERSYLNTKKKTISIQGVSFKLNLYFLFLFQIKTVFTHLV